MNNWAWKIYKCVIYGQNKYLNMKIYKWVINSIMNNWGWKLDKWTMNGCEY
jgi:hypothetical protein